MEKITKKLPVVAIVGRPNVGKSTLFNKLVKRKKAIVSPVPGVTRDRNSHVITLDNSQFELVDTGGFTTDKEDSFKDFISKQARVAMDEADFILFLCEYDDVTRDDVELAKIVKESGKNFVLLVNKVDNEKRENYIYQHYELNLGEPVPFSVLQGYNMDLLLDIIKQNIPQTNEILNADDENIVNVSIVGKPNTGKSTLLNFILGEERSIVSEVPGTTRDAIEEIIEYKDKKIRFVDTAGIRRKNKVTEDIEFYSVRRAIGSIEHSDVIVLMIDAQENITEQDKKIAGIALQRGKALIIAVNKWDLVKHEYKSFASYEDYLRFKFAVAHFVPVINISAIYGKNVKKLLNLIIKVNFQYRLRVDTGEFNRFLQEIVHANPPKLKRGNFKIYYGTQPMAAPVSFVLFCNNPDNCPAQYKNYIINRIREKYGFDGIPLNIKLKGRENKKAANK